MKKKFILSSLLLLTGLFAVGCSNDPNVTMNESQIKDAISAGLEKDPYTSADVTFKVDKCDVSVSASGVTTEQIEAVKTMYTSQFLAAYASTIGESSVEIGQSVKRTFNQAQCDMLRLGSDFLNKYTENFNKNYYQKPDGNFVMELSTETTETIKGVTQNVKSKDVVTFDERSYIVREEVSSTLKIFDDNSSITMETLTINDVVYQ